MKKPSNHEGGFGTNRNGKSLVIADLLQSLSNAVAGGAKPMHIDTKALGRIKKEPDHGSK